MIKPLQFHETNRGGRSNNGGGTIPRDTSGGDAVLIRLSAPTVLRIQPQNLARSQMPSPRCQWIWEDDPAEDIGGEAYGGRQRCGEGAGLFGFSRY